ncbi:SDR family oxidoreductase [Gordonia sinesedis]
MGRYLVTGAASGIGAAIAASLRAEGHSVIGVDRNLPADAAGPTETAHVVADLATVAGRADAAAAIIDRCAGRLDGAVMAAGLGPARGRERAILNVNVLGVTDLLTAVRPALAAAGNAKVVVLGSNSTTSTPLVPRAALRRLDRGDTAGAARIIGRRPSALRGPLAYAASKLAVTRWCRRRSVSPDWAGAGIRLNLIAPGPVQTPLLDEQLASETGKNVRAFPIPLGQFGTTEQIAAWAMMMLSPQADVMTGTVVTIDGGTEALLRTADWPRSLPVTGIPRLVSRMSQARNGGRRVRQ